MNKSKIGSVRSTVRPFTDFGVFNSDFDSC